MRRRERPVRDVDSVERALRIKALAWSLIMLAPGVALGLAIADRTRLPVLLIVPLVAIVVVGGFVVVSLFVAERIGRVGSAVFFSSGASTRSAREYSRADALLAAGRIEEARAELESAAERYPDDAQPCLLLARVLRDRCARPEEAVLHFRAAIARSREPGLELATLREIVEIWTHRVGQPRRALPDLARIAHRFPDSPAAVWARGEMSRIKASMEEADAPPRPPA